MRTTPRTPLHAAVSVELARASLTQRALADRLGIPDTSLSDWLRGAHPSPPDLPRRIESALGLRRGVLTRTPQHLRRDMGEP
jgi:DNA-binding transcriptional regulator YdaS (Cro superfamily)